VRAWWINSLVVASFSAVVASLHLGGVLDGGSEPFDPTAAGIAEAIIGVALTVGSPRSCANQPMRRRSQSRRHSSRSRASLSGSPTVRGGGAIDIAYHAAMLPLLLLTLILLLRSRWAP
jgi:hypothetical protein